jgi:hypothetical protein
VLVLPWERIAWRERAPAERFPAMGHPPAAAIGDEAVRVGTRGAPCFHLETIQAMGFILGAIVFSRRCFFQRTINTLCGRHLCRLKLPMRA